MDPAPEPVVVEAGRRRMVAPALFRDVIRNPRQWRTDLRAARGAGDVYGVRGDWKPLAAVVMSLGHTWRYRRQAGADRHRQTLIASQFYDISWDGEPIRPDLP